MFLRKAVGSRVREILVDLLRIVDLAAIVAAGLGSFYLRHGSMSLLPIQVDVLVVTPVVMSYALHLAAAYASNRAFNILASLRSVGWAASWAALALLALGFATKTSVEISRVWMATWLAGAVVLMVGVRIVLRLWLARSGGARVLRWRIAVIGAQPMLGQLMERIDGNGGHLDVMTTAEIGAGAKEATDLARALAVVETCAQHRHRHPR
jgi:FlaA1/EpsC-like NDP-sugar epimerase